MVTILSDLASDSQRPRPPKTIINTSRSSAEQSSKQIPPLPRVQGPSEHPSGTLAEACSWLESTDREQAHSSVQFSPLAAGQEPATQRRSI